MADAETAESEVNPNEIRILPPKKRRKVEFALRCALLEVIERKKVQNRVDYKQIAKDHSTTSGNLRNTYYLYCRGRIDMGLPGTEEEKRLDMRVEHERLMMMCHRYQCVVTHGFEGLLNKAESALSNGGALGWQKMGLPSVLKEVKAILDIKKDLEKGYTAILDEEAGRRQREEKRLLGNSVNPVADRMSSASDEVRALQLLSDGDPELPRPT